MRKSIIIFLTAIIFFCSLTPVQAKKRETIYVPVLMYHQISKKESRLGEYVISPQEFEDDLKLLKENNYTTITVASLIDYIKKGKKLPEKPVILTFDDGYQSDFVYAYPLLKQYDMKAVFSIVGEYTNKYSQEGIDKHIDYAHLCWDEIKEMNKSGTAEFLSHSYDLHKNGKRRGALKMKGESDDEYEKFLSEDIEKINQAFIDHLGKAPVAFTCPFGCYNGDLRDNLKNSGYSAILTSQQKINRFSGDLDELYRINRIVRNHGMNLKKQIEKWEDEIDEHD